MNDDAFKWDEYMDFDASYPASDPRLFRHILFGQSTLLKKLVEGREIRVRFNGEIIQCRAELVTNSKILAPVNGSIEIIDANWIVHDDDAEDNKTNVASNSTGNDRNVDDNLTSANSVDDNTVKGKTLGNANEECFNNANGRKGNVLRMTADELKLSSCSLIDLIKEGQYLELQDSRDPVSVHIAKVMSNRGGLLTLSYNNKKDILYFTSERCHAIGWISEQEQECKYTNNAMKLLEVAKSNPVSLHVFGFSKTPEHSFATKVMVEVLDVVKGGIMYPGFVSEIINRHYFRVRISNKIKGTPRDMVCHRLSPYIFPTRFCERNSLRLTPPQDYGNESFSWERYKTLCGLSGATLPDAHWGSLLDSNVVNTFHKLRNVEVFDVRRNVMYPGKVLRSVGDVIWIHKCHVKFASLPAIVSARSHLIFPCGFAGEYGIPMEQAVRPYDLESKAPLDYVPDFTNRYMPKVLQDETLWIPEIFVNRCCYPGPFINPKKFEEFPDRYSASPLMQITEKIIVDLICAAYDPLRFSKMISCIKCDEKPFMIINAERHFAKPNARSCLVRVEVCEQRKEFFGWLRSFCVLLDACPDLFSIGKNGTCPAKCAEYRKHPTVDTMKSLWTYIHHNDDAKMTSRLRTLLEDGAVAIPAKRRSVRSIYSSFGQCKEFLKSEIEAAPANSLMKLEQIDSTVSRSGQAFKKIPAHSTTLDSYIKSIDPKCIEKFVKSLPEVTSSPKTWTTVQLLEWIEKARIPVVETLFYKEEVDGEAFLLLNMAECLHSLGLKLGPALKVLVAADMLNTKCNDKFAES